MLGTGLRSGSRMRSTFCRTEEIDMTATTTGRPTKAEKRAQKAAAAPDAPAAATPARKPHKPAGGAHAPAPTPEPVQAAARPGEKLQSGRRESKGSMVLAMLRRPQGATNA